MKDSEAITISDDENAIDHCSDSSLAAHSTEIISIDDNDDGDDEEQDSQVLDEFDDLEENDHANIGPGVIDRDNVNVPAVSVPVEEKPDTALLFEVNDHSSASSSHAHDVDSESSFGPSIRVNDNESDSERLQASLRLVNFILAKHSLHLFAVPLVNVSDIRSLADGGSVSAEEKESSMLISHFFGTRRHIH
jgi:hypothetical protein